MPRRRDQGDEVELLAPDLRALGVADDGAAVRHAGPRRDDVGDDGGPPSRRGASLGAGVIVAALLVAGVVAAAPWDGDEAAPSSTTPSSTTPSTSTPPLGDDPADSSGADGLGPSRAGRFGFAPGLGGLAVDLALDRVRGPVEAGEPFQLWATSGARIGAGSFVAVQVVPARRAEPVPLARRREMTSDRIAVERRSPAGVTELRVPLGDHVGVLTASGWDDAALLDLAERLRGDGDRQPFFVGGVPGDHRLLPSGGESDAGPDLEQRYLDQHVGTVAAYARDDGTTLTVRSAELSLASERLAPFVVGTAPESNLSGPSTRFDVGGRQVMGGVLLWSGDRVVRWIEPSDDPDRPDAVVTVTAALPLDELLDVVADVRRLDADGWAATVSGAASRRPTAFPTRFVPIGGGVLDGEDAEVAVDPSGTWLQISIGGAAVARPVSSIPGAMLVEASPDALTVVALVPDQMAGSTLVVRTPRTEQVVAVVPFGEGPPGALTAGAALVTDLTGPVEVRVVAADGAIIGEVAI